MKTELLNDEERRLSRMIFNQVANFHSAGFQEVRKAFPGRSMSDLLEIARKYNYEVTTELFSRKTDLNIPVSLQEKETMLKNLIKK